jgi:hypothetical protein
VSQATWERQFEAEEVESMPKDEAPVSLHGLTPEEALRALLAVKPDDPDDDADEGEAQQ